MYVRMSERISAAPNGQIFVKFRIGALGETAEEHQTWLKSGINLGHFA
jgi:hypothetical protein